MVRLDIAGKPGNHESESLILGQETKISNNESESLNLYSHFLKFSKIVLKITVIYLPGLIGFTRFTRFTRFTSMSTLAKKEIFYQKSRFTRFTKFTRFTRFTKMQISCVGRSTTMGPTWTDLPILVWLHKTYTDIESLYCESGLGAAACWKEREWLLQKDTFFTRIYPRYP